MTDPRDLLIVALPWQRYDTTAVQLGAIQAWLRRDGYVVDSRHYYKDLIDYVSPDVYMRVFEAYMGESAFAALMFPERFEQIKEAICATVDFDLATDGASSAVLKHPQLNANLSYAERKQLAEASKVVESRAPLDFDVLVKQLSTFLDDVFEAVEWDRYRVIAFTTSHQQLIATALLARRIKAAHPAIPIVIGGALMVRDLPRNVLECFECFDIVVSGEGERTVSALMPILSGRSDASLCTVPGIVWRDNGTIVDNGGGRTVEDLDELPVPDYYDYFRHGLRREVNVQPKLTVEGSRACVWGRCTYCNLNLQWNNVYRRKSHARMATEMSELRSRHHSTFFTMCDTNVEDKIPLFEMLAAQPGDYRILAEISPNVTRSGVKSLRDAGVRTIQVGIESFSNRVLKLYQRNHRVLRSLEMLKWAMEFDVEIYYNLIINFPAEVPEDVERSMEVVRFARYFNYPSIHDYSFTMQSPAYEDMASYNIAGWDLPSDVKDVYPEPYATRLAQMLALTIHPRPAEDRGVDWGPLLAYVDRWKRAYHANLGRPGLVFSDGGDFLVLTVRGGGQGNDVVMTLPDEHRLAYLACSHAATPLSRIADDVGSVPLRRLGQILDELVDLEVAYADQGRYLALALPDRSTGSYPLGADLGALNRSEPAMGAEPVELRTKHIVQVRAPVGSRVT